MNRRPEGGYQPQAIDYGNGLVAVQTPDGQWTVREVSSGGSAPAYSSSREAYDRAEAFDREQLALQREQEQNRQRETLLGYGVRLLEAEKVLRQKREEMLTGLVGVSPLRAAAAQSGVVPRGQEPADALRSELRSLNAAPLPSLSASAPLPQLQQQVESLKQFPSALPTGGAYGGAGMGGGGVIEMSRGEDGSYGMAGGAGAMEGGGGMMGGGGGMHQMPDGSMMPDAEMRGAMSGQAPQAGVQMGTQKRAYLVGEGATQVEPGTEVVVVDSLTGTTEVVPLGGGAAEGGTFNTSIGTALAPVWDSLGFTTPPSYRTTPATLSAPEGRGLIPRGFTGGNLAGIQRLGVQPRLVRDASTGQVYYKNPAGALQAVSPRNFKMFGFNAADVINLSPAEIRTLGPLSRAGGGLTSVPIIEPGVAGRRFPQMTVPIIEPSTGYALPAPRTIASMIRNQPGPVKSALVEALTLSGLYTPESIEDELRFFTPSGTGTRAGAAIFG